MSNKLLTERAMSGFPVSIGTSLALESLLDPVQEVIDPNRVVSKVENPSTYSLLVFNTSTLLRNIIQSIPGRDMLTIPFKDFYEVLLEEIDYLQTTLQLAGITSKFYTNNYKYVKDTYGPKNILRTPKLS